MKTIQHCNLYSAWPATVVELDDFVPQPCDTWFEVDTDAGTNMLNISACPVCHGQIHQEVGEHND